MCGSAHGASNVPDNWLGGPYQVYPIEGELPELSEKWDGVDLKTIKAMFPDRLEAYCVLALIAAAEENQEWAGATYDYLDRLAIGGLRREHSKIAWKRLGKWIWSFGKSKELTRADAFVLLTQSFINLFWGSMRGMIVKGYVRVEQREIDFMDVDVFFPTARLVNKINCSLAS